jgi:cytochrome c6
MKNSLRILSLLALTTATSALWAADGGQRLYQMHCANCHGITGIPVMPQTPNLAMREGMNKPDFMLVQSLKMGGRGKPPFIGILSDKELMDIIQYIRVMR